MEFGIFSNGFRPHTTASQTYDEDLAEIVLADQLGFRDAYISEHHGEPVYIDKVDTLPVPELLMCKAAALTKRIRMGAAVKLIHLAHPVDTAIQAAVTDHVIGGGRFIFGFGSGFPSPLFANERGLSHEDRHERLRESLDLILKCWTAPEPFDWDGKFWRGKGIVATPRPLVAPHMPMATATDTPAMIDLAGARGYTLLSAQIDSAGIGAQEGGSLCARREGRRPRHAAARSHRGALRLSRRFRGARPWTIYVPAFTCELGYQKKRGFIRLINASYGLSLVENEVTFDQLAEAGIYYFGDPDTVARQLREFYEACRRIRHAPDRGRQELGDPRQSISLDAPVHGSRWRRSLPAWCRCAILTAVAA